MKCISCGNEIPNNSQSCPFCGENVIKTDSLMETATLPVTPSEIQLPSDQAKMANTGAINIIPEEEIDMPNLIKDDMVTEEVNTQAPVAESTISEQENVVEETKSDMTDLINSEPIVITGGTIDVEQASASIEPEMETVTFGMDKKDTQDPLMKKQFPIKAVLIAVAVIILGCAGYFGYYYLTQFTTSDKRIDAVIDKFFDSVVADTKNEQIEKQSAKFSSLLSYTQNNDIYKIEFDGNYGIDLKQRMMNFALNIKDIKLGEEVIIDKNSPINLKTFIEGDTISVDIPNFYDKYISQTSSGIGSILNSIEQNDVDYTNMINAYKKSLKAAFREMTKSQNVSKVTFDGKTTKANIVTIELTGDNQKKFYDKLVDTLVEDKLFIRDYSLFMGVEENALIASLNESKSGTYNDSKTKLEICTAMYAEELVGIRLSDDTHQLDLYTIDNGFELSYIENTKKVFDVSFTSTSNKTVNAIEKAIKLNIVVNSDNDIHKITVELNVTSDVNPVIEQKENKETIPVEYIDEESKNNIMNNILNYGKFGAIVQQLLIPQPVVYEEAEIPYEIELPMETQYDEINYNDLTNDINIGDITY